MAKIAVDYDNTYTSDPNLWHKFMVDADEAGHQVFIVTYRDERFDIDDRLDFIEQDGFSVFYTRGVAKKWWCEQFGPGSIDIWIDDKPEAIFNNSPITVQGLDDWRKEQPVE